MSSGATHTWIDTAAGRSAVAVVVASGPDACGAVERCFLPATAAGLSSTPYGVIRFGRWKSADGEEVVVVRRGPTKVEVHCHGGVAASRAVVSALVHQGCTARRDAPPRQGAAVSQLQWDAQQALRHAVTERTAAIALDQAQGALHDAVAALADQGLADSLLRGVHQLLRWADLGCHVTRPWRVVLTGAPNVGKSSLVNAMVGFSRVLVFDQPGTTRDVISVQAAIDGWPVWLLDTAGLRDSNDALEAQGVRLAREALAAADLVVEVRDATDPSSAIVDLPAKRLVVWNKCDLGTPPRGAKLATSATTSQGITRLLTAIAQSLAPEAPAPGAAAPLTDRHVASLNEAATHASRGDVRSAQAALRALLAPAADID